MEHTLKTWPEPFSETVTGRKRFEFRKNDRNYQVGDTLILREWLPDYLTYTGRELVVKVTYILYNGFDMPAGYCIMSIAPIEKEPEPTSADLDMQDHTPTVDAKKETARLIAERGMS